MHWSISVPGYDMLVWYGMTGCDAAYAQHTKNIKTSALSGSGKADNVYL